MIARLPDRIQPNTVNDSPNYFADWFPTLCDAAGFEKPSGLDGQSLWPVLTSNALTSKYSFTASRKPMVWVFPEYGGQVAVRVGDLKAVRQNLKTKTPGQSEVYDIFKDRNEQRDIAADHSAFIVRVQEILRREVADNEYFPLTIPGVTEQAGLSN